MCWPAVWAALRLALVYARRGELAEGQRWADRAAALGPASVAERAARLRDALRQELFSPMPGFVAVGCMVLGVGAGARVVSQPGGAGCRLRWDGAPPPSGTTACS
ncbi:hypothetical protein SVIOM74S_06759 [Streptomyces violarus]